MNVVDSPLPVVARPSSTQVPDKLGDGFRESGGVDSLGDTKELLLPAWPVISMEKKHAVGFYGYRDLERRKHHRIIWKMFNTY